jgi:DNA repair exonuclease SbcCD nuclease subunit
MKFIHTADWQLGKPFARIDDVQKRSALQQERVEVIKRMGAVAHEAGADFVLVAGDVFDSSSASKSTVAAACSAIGHLKLPVLVIPGNHDHGGPGSLWEQEFFQRERESLAPNLHILLKAQPFELETAIIFPCPLLRRAESVDTTSWLRSAEVLANQGDSKPRIILAHGSTQAFMSRSDDEAQEYATNQLDLSRLPEDDYDYVALGDWHGTKKVGPKAWFSGTPELDRFPKGEENDPGNILIVEVERGQIPQVTPVRTSRFRWSQLSFDLADDASFTGLTERLMDLLGQRANEDLLQLHVTGALGIATASRLEQLIDSLQARLLRVKLTNAVTIAPTEEEIQSLTQRQMDPLIARVAQQLVARSGQAADDADVAATALRELHAALAGR